MSQNSMIDLSREVSAVLNQEFYVSKFRLFLKSGKGKLSYFNESGKCVEFGEVTGLIGVSISKELDFLQDSPQTNPLFNGKYILYCLQTNFIELSDLNTRLPIVNCILNDSKGVEIIGGFQMTRLRFIDGVQNQNEERENGEDISLNSLGFREQQIIGFLKQQIVGAIERVREIEGLLEVNQ